MPRFRCAVAAMVFVAAVAGCGGSDSTETPTQTREAGAEAGTESAQRFPRVLAVTAQPAGEGTFDFSVTISSRYDSPERYADGWRIVAPDGEPIAEHELLHDHADEQPFTREQTGVEIPEGVEQVTVEPRDSENGYGGDGRSLKLPGR